MEIGQVAVSAPPWRWFPDRGPWLAKLVDAAAAWRPAVTTSCSPDAVARMVDDAEGAQWLYHPCVSALTHRYHAGRYERDLALLGWLAANGGLEGEVVLAEPMWCWSNAGGVVLDQGTHRLDSVAAVMVTDDALPEVGLDPWCTILGYAHPGTVPASEMAEDEQEALVHRNTLVGLRALRLLRVLLPEVADWLTAYVKILVFLDGGGTVSRSSSAAELPGIVFADAVSELALLEVLVHEAAHHLLYLEEVRGPLVDPLDNRRFVSPLRPDPRPLRGILLAYHALAFICAFYADLEHASADGNVTDATDLANLRAKAGEAEATIDAASSALTDQGKLFVQSTKNVTRHGS
jgi:hypothetical protein